MNSNISKDKVPSKRSNVIYIGHLPHGFFEKELKSFFNQFGQVLKVHVKRSKKTAGSKGYAFIMFAESSVAKIAANTMNNYLMYDKIIKCHVIPKEKIHRGLFSGFKIPAKLYYKTWKAAEIMKNKAIKKFNGNRFEQNNPVIYKKREEEWNNKIKSKGINYEYITQN